jgi:hypothetical protein
VAAGARLERHDPLEQEVIVSRKRHVRYVAVRAHSETSEGEYLKARLGGGTDQAAPPRPNRADRRREAKLARRKA